MRVRVEDRGVKQHHQGLVSDNLILIPSGGSSLTQSWCKEEELAAKNLIFVSRGPPSLIRVSFRLFSC
jgi:hypothetical protein